MSHKNSTKLFVSLLFLLLPRFCFLAVFFSVVAFLSFLPIRGIVRLNSPGVQTSSRLWHSFGRSTGSTAGIVRVKLENNKSCQCTFPSRGAWHQWALKKTAVALVFPFLQLAWNWQSIHGSPPLSSVFVRTRGWLAFLLVSRQGR